MISIVAVTFLLLFALYSGTCIPAVAAALKQFLFVVLPSIFPFYTVSYLLRKTSFFGKLSGAAGGIMRPVFGISGSGAFAVMVGAVSGYPAGARVAVDLYKDGLLTLEDVRRLSSFTNNTGPLFMIGAVGVGMLGSLRCGVLLWVCHFLASLLAGILVCGLRRIAGRRMARRQAAGAAERTEIRKASALPGGTGGKLPIGRLLPEAMTGAMYTMIPIAAAIVFFAAFNGVLAASGLTGLAAKYALPFLPEPVAQGVCKGFFEITGGITEIAAYAGPLPLRLAVISAVSGFAGVSVYFQAAGIYAECGVKTGSYLAGKCVQAGIAFLLTLAAGAVLRI